MIDTTITALLGAVVVFSVCQPNPERLFAGVCFSTITLAHEAILSDLPGVFYYLSAALADLLIIMATSAVYPVPKMVIRLQKVCVASIVVNLFGWIVWFAYLPPWPYELAFVFVYAAAVITLVRQDGSNVGGFTMAGWRSCFRVNTCSGAEHIH